MAGINGAFNHGDRAVPFDPRFCGHVYLARPPMHGQRAGTFINFFDMKIRHLREAEPESFYGRFFAHQPR